MSRKNKTLKCLSLIPAPVSVARSAELNDCPNESDFPKSDAIKRTDAFYQEHCPTLPASPQMPVTQWNNGNALRIDRVNKAGNVLGQRLQFVPKFPSEFRSELRAKTGKKGGELTALVNECMKDNSKLAVILAQAAFTATIQAGGVPMHLDSNKRDTVRTMKIAMPAPVKAPKVKVITVVSTVTKAADVNVDAFTPEEKAALIARLTGVSTPASL